MSGLKEAFDDIAAEISPADPPVELTMRQGKRINNGRLAAVVGGTTGTIVITVGALLGFPVLLGHGGGMAAPASMATANAAPVRESDGSVNAAPLPRPHFAPLLRPVLLESPQGGTAEYGNVALVDAATLKMYRSLTCAPGPNAETVNENWKATIGYTAAQWNVPNSQVVSCDAAGTRYVLGPAVVLSGQVTSATTVGLASSQQWDVDVTLDQVATQALAAVTKYQYAAYFPGAATDQDDAALDSTALVLNGDVYSAPMTEAPLTHGQIELKGPQPAGFTQAEAAALAARL
jgi:hypothetical protein